ncbi:MAG: hypothetical protein Q8O64_00255 [Sideroxyarcus sp.]|nr:hypothetical protein [Sideroxyarcus sp.]
MNKYWMMCGLLVLAGCQGEQPQPAVTKPAGAVVNTTPATPAAKQSSEEEAPAPVTPVTKPEVSRAPAQAVEQAGKIPEPTVAPPVTTPITPPPTSAPIVVTAPVAAAPATATGETDAAAMALARKSNCFACHALDKKVMGPTWKAVASKYRGDVNAQTYLANRIAKGGGGVWGAVPMPAQPGLSAEQSAQLARFILQLN